MANKVEIKGETATYDYDKEQVTREYILTYDSIVSANDAVGDSGIPARGSHYAHPFTGAVAQGEEKLVKSISAKIESNFPKTWVVTVNYDDEPDEFTRSPLSRDPIIRWGFIEGTETYFIDTEDAKVINKAGDPFENLPERENVMLTVEYIVNLSAFDPVTSYLYANAVNLGSFSIDGVIIPAGKAKMSAPKAEPKKMHGVEYYEITYKMKFNEDGWKFEPLNEGFNEIANGELVPIVDFSGKQVTKPRPLDENGAAKDVGEEADALEFKPYRELSFSGFGFS